MDEVNIARALHVLGVIVWVGGVGFVTTIVFPAVLRIGDPGERVALFDKIERRFVWQAPAATLLVGISGFYLVYDQSLWDRFGEPEYWWMHAMVAIWAVFSVMLFVVEPLFLHCPSSEILRQKVA